MTAENPIISTEVTTIILVSYHTGPVLFEAIAAILKQTAAIELCLVNNGNTPEVLARLEVLAAEDKRIRFITGHGNIGFSRACNLGARSGSGTYYLFLNPDSLLPPDAIEKLNNEKNNLTRPFMLGARLIDDDGKNQRGCRRALLTPRTAFIEALHIGKFFPKERLNFNDEAIPSKTIPIPAISGAFIYVPREDFWAIDGFDEGYFLHVEDLDLCWRFRKAGGEIYFVPNVVVTHLGGTSKATKAFVEKHKARGFMRYFHKNFKDYPVLFLLLLDAAVWVRASLKISLAKI